MYSTKICEQSGQKSVRFHHMSESPNNSPIHTNFTLSKHKLRLNFPRSTICTRPTQRHTNSRLFDFGKLRGPQLLPLVDNTELLTSVATSNREAHY